MITEPRTPLAPPTLEAAGLMQSGPPYHCFKCGIPARGFHLWLPCGSPLDAWAEHIAYLRLNCGCAQASRMAKLGDWITPLAFYTDRGDFLSWSEFVEANVQAVRQALALLAAAVPADALTADEPTRIVRLVLAGQLPPDAAIAQIRALLAGEAC